jgi:cytochrome b involved in lipid metabolism
MSTTPSAVQSVAYEQSSWGKGIEPKSVSHAIQNPLDLWRPLIVVSIQIGILSWLHETVIFSSETNFPLFTSLIVPSIATAVYLTFVAWGLSRLRKRGEGQTHGQNEQAEQKEQTKIQHDHHNDNEVQISFSMYSDDELRPWMLSFNVYQCLLNTYVVLELIREVWLNPAMTSIWGNALLLPNNPLNRRLSFLILVHSQNKIIELSDTIFMVLRGKTKQVTTLHVWHHLLLLWSWYLVVRYACGGDAYFGALINSFTHVLVYLHYALTTFGYGNKINKWKKYLTSLQMLQFVVCGAHAIFCLIVGNYPQWLCLLNLFVQINMSIMFTTFFKLNYSAQKTNQSIGQVEERKSTDTAAEKIEGTSNSSDDGGGEVVYYTRKDVARRNGSKGSHWCIVNYHGKRRVLDITGFISKHPGGNVIVLASGIDATILAHTYHPNGLSKQIINELTIGQVKASDVDDETSSSYYDWNSEFYTVLKSRVNQKLRKLNKNRRGGYEIWIKSILLLLSFWYHLFVMCTSKNVYIASYASIMMGASASFIGTCIQHDGSHGA